MTAKQLTNKIERFYKVVKMLSKTLNHDSNRSRDWACEFDNLKAIFVEMGCWSDVAKSLMIPNCTNGGDMLA